MLKIFANEKQRKLTKCIWLDRTYTILLYRCYLCVNSVVFRNINNTHTHRCQISEHRIRMRYFYN